MSSLRFRIALATAAAVLCACSGGEKPQPEPAKKAAAPAEPPRITQLYASVPTVAAGGKSLICYGTESADAVWLSPPRQELSDALSRCVEVTPSKTTTYTLTAERAGKSVTQAVTVAVGPAPKPRAKIIEVTVTSLSVHPGEPVSLCYNVENAASVSIDPIKFKGSSDPKGCAIDKPAKTTTYVVTARGAENQDTERVTVKVQ